MMILIDTQWNVKPGETVMKGQGLNINRYIVECKALEQSYVSSISSNINRYIVECKDYDYQLKLEVEDILIDTQWNVKVVSTEMAAETTTY